MAFSLYKSNSNKSQQSNKTSTFNVLTAINRLSVLSAFFAYFMLDALWYLLLFPKRYRITLGTDPEINPHQAPIFITGPAVCAVAHR